MPKFSKIKTRTDEDIIEQDFKGVSYTATFDRVGDLIKIDTENTVLMTFAKSRGLL
jgi:hypothetical protein